MAKSGRSGRSGERAAKDRYADDHTSDPDYEVLVSGDFKGKIRDVEVGLITGKVTQANSSVQLAANISAGGDGSQENDQSASQTNQIVTEGDANFGIVVNGQFEGQIRDIEVGLITGDVTQTNTAFQAAANVSAGYGSGSSQANDQSVVQTNLIEAIGNIDVNMVINGEFKGKIRDVEIGLITADVTQINDATQLAANISAGGGGGSSQANDQSVSQTNHLAVIGDIDITIVFDGDFKGQFRDVRIGVATGDISQSNTAIQVGLNVSGGRGDLQSNSQLITQTNTVDPDGDLHVTLVVDADHKGDFRDIDITLTVDNILQSNDAGQIAVNGALHDVWG
jgi:hypothetical protein